MTTWIPPASLQDHPHRLTADCGCIFLGRQVSSARCSVIAPQWNTITGTQRYRHQAAALRTINRSAA